MSQPFISIIIPTYNSDKTLTDCLESIFNQSVSDYEVIIIDAVSSDNTIPIVKHYANVFPNVHWISQKDKGIYDAMNKGLRLAKGEWLYFMGSDDVLLDNLVLQNILALALKKETVMIYGKAFVSPDNFITPIDFNFEKLLRYNICHQTIFYSRHVFEQYEYATKFGTLGDWDLNLKIFATYPAERILAVDLMICKFFNTGISADWKSRQEYIKYFKNPFKLYFRYCNFQKAFHLSFRNLLKFRNFNKNRFLPFLSF